jgi:hypothetical protein
MKSCYQRHTWANGGIPSWVSCYHIVSLPTKWPATSACRMGSLNRRHLGWLCHRNSFSCWGVSPTFGPHQQHSLPSTYEYLKDILGPSLFSQFFPNPNFHSHSSTWVPFFPPSASWIGYLSDSVRDLIIQIPAPPCASIMYHAVTHTPHFIPFLLQRFDGKYCYNYFALQHPPMGSKKSKLYTTPTTSSLRFTVSRQWGSAGATRTQSGARQHHRHFISTLFRAVSREGRATGACGLVTRCEAWHHQWDHIL